MYHLDELSDKQKEKFQEFTKVVSSYKIDLDYYTSITKDFSYLWYTDSYFPDNFLADFELEKNYEKFQEYITNLRILISNSNSTERDVLNYISNDKLFIAASILKNLTVFGHHDRYIFKEFQLPPHHVCDYLVIGKNSDGYHFLLIEFENIYKNITISDGDFGSTIRKGLSQIDDWKCWMDKNYATFWSNLKRFKNKHKHLPDEFSEYDSTRFSYCVIAGRRKDFKEKTYRKARVLSKQNIIVTHYDKLLEEAEDVLKCKSY